MKRYHCLPALWLVLFSACLDDDFLNRNSPCGDDISLGSFALSDTTEQYLPYAGSEVLVFKDSLARKYELRSAQGVAISEDKALVRQLCTGLLSGSQYEYFDTEAKAIAFQDSTGSDIFSLSVTTTSNIFYFEELDSLTFLDSLVVFDAFKFTSREFENSRTSFSIVTAERQNALSADYINRRYNDHRVVGDTLLRGTLFEDVIIAEFDYYNYTVLFNIEDGVIAFKDGREPFWILEK